MSAQVVEWHTSPSTVSTTISRPPTVDLAQKRQKLERKLASSPSTERRAKFICVTHAVQNISLMVEFLTILEEPSVGMGQRRPNPIRR